MNKVIEKKEHTPAREHNIFRKDISLFLVGLVALAILNILAQQYFFRIDLTEENRYSVSDATKNMLRGLESPVMVTVYLEGDLPAGFTRLQKSIRETLEEFQVYAGQHLTYRFVDPLKATSDEKRNEFFLRLDSLGVQPTRLFDEENGKRIQKMIFPGAVVRHKNQEAGVMLLKGNRIGGGAQEALNQSIEGIEYELATAIRKLAVPEKRQVGLIKGHGELESLEIASLTQAISEFYDIYEINLPEREEIPSYDALLIGKPREAFSKEDKYKLDQYIMRGGKVMFFIDPLAIDMDSIGSGGSFAFPLDLNLDDQLFRYGVRINKNLLQDIKSGVYPIVVGNVGEQPQVVPLQWPFFPIVNRYSAHPIARNLDAIYLKFVSNIDTVKAEGVTKTPLIFTSQYSRVLTTPVVVNLDELREAPRPEAFRSGPQAVAYLLEGTFTSAFRNRVLPDMADPRSFLEKSTSTKIIVCSDGELIRNEINRRTGEPLPLGYDPITERQFANKDFVLNALSYLTDEEGLITARTKEIQIRPLDQVKVKRESTQWQFINLFTPILLIVAFGAGKFYLRRRKYTGFKVT